MANPTRPAGSTLPNYSFVYISEGAGLGVVSTSTGDLSGTDSWRYGSGITAPYNLVPVAAVAPASFNILAQGGSASYAAAGGDINLKTGVGSVANVSGNVVIADTAGNSGWNTAHLKLGIYHIWVDATGDLRIKNSAPTTDLDGTIIGTQS